MFHLHFLDLLFLLRQGVSLLFELPLQLFGLNGLCRIELFLFELAFELGDISLRFDSVVGVLCRNLGQLHGQVTESETEVLHHRAKIFMLLYCCLRRRDFLLCLLS